MAASCFQFVLLPPLSSRKQHIVITQIIQQEYHSTTHCQRHMFNNTHLTTTCQQHIVITLLSQQRTSHHILSTTHCHHTAHLTTSSQQHIVLTPLITDHSPQLYLRPMDSGKMLRCGVIRSITDYGFKYLMPYSTIHGISCNLRTKLSD